MTRHRALQAFLSARQSGQFGASRRPLTRPGENLAKVARGVNCAGARRGEREGRNYVRHYNAVARGRKVQDCVSARTERDDLVLVCVKGRVKVDEQQLAL
jgi:hypothetical protein